MLFVAEIVSGVLTLLRLGGKSKACPLPFVAAQ